MELLLILKYFHLLNIWLQGTLTWQEHLESQKHKPFELSKMANKKRKQLKDYKKHKHLCAKIKGERPNKWKKDIQNMSTVEPHFRTTEKKCEKNEAKTYESTGSYWLLAETIKTCIHQECFLELPVLKTSAVESQFIPLIEPRSTSQSTSWLTSGLSLVLVQL